MDRHEKQIVLLNCNSIPVDALDQYISREQIAISEFESHRLSDEKLKELRRLDDIRNQIIVDSEINKELADPDFFKEIPREISIIDRITNEELSAIEIDFLVKDLKITYDDLKAAGVPQKVIAALTFLGKRTTITRFHNIEDLPEMEDGRTDIFMVGMPASGKSTILASIFKYASECGINISDSYNQEGNVYMEHLKKNLDFGLFPMGTVKGSYNYIATAFKDEQGENHPFNIVEVPGENYTCIFSNGLNDEANSIKGFINYIKSKNKKILVFVIDAIAEIEKFTNPDLFNALDQGIAYNNIFGMFRDNKILERTDAIYFVVNKFDALKKNQFIFDERPDEELALEFLQKNFASLLTSCKEAKKGRNKFSIKVLPFSVGEIRYQNILTDFDTKYVKNIVDNMLMDSFVVSKGSFWKIKF